MQPHESRLEDLVARTRGLQPWRRLFHAANGVLLAVTPGLLGLSRAMTVTLLGAAFLVALGLDLLRLRNPEWNASFFRAFRHLASPREAKGIASSTWYMLGGALAWGLFPPLYASAGLLVLGLADPVASVIGRVWGSFPLGKGSIQGSLAFTLTAWIVLIVVTGEVLPVLWVAVGVALMEIVPGLVDDNLVVPLSTGTLLWLILGTPATTTVLPF